MRGLESVSSFGKSGFPIADADDFCLGREGASQDGPPGSASSEHATARGPRLKTGLRLVAHHLLIQKHDTYCWRKEWNRCVIWSHWEVSAVLKLKEVREGIG